MKKLTYAVTALLSAVFASSASAEVSVSGSVIAGAVNDGAASVTKVRTGGGVSFAMSTTTDNGITISTGAGITRDTDGTSAAAVTGLKSVSFATGGATLSVGNHKVAGRNSGDIGGVISDFSDSSTVGASGVSTGLTAVEGHGVWLTTSMGGATVTADLIYDLSDTDNEGATNATTSATGVSVALPLGDLAVTVGFAQYDPASGSSEQTTGVSAAYAMSAGTVTVGYQTSDLATDATSSGATFKTSMGDASLSVGYKSVKKSTTTNTTQLAISQPLGGGASVFAEVDSVSGTGTTGTAFAVGTSVSF
jgi:hypothetical protein